MCARTLGEAGCPGSHLPKLWTTLAPFVLPQSLDRMRSPFLGCSVLVGASVPFTGLQESRALQPSWSPLGPMATAVSF